MRQSSVKSESWECVKEKIRLERESLSFELLSVHALNICAWESVFSDCKGESESPLTGHLLLRSWIILHPCLHQAVCIGNVTLKSCMLMNLYKHLQSEYTTDRNGTAPREIPSDIVLYSSRGSKMASGYKRIALFVEGFVYLLVMLILPGIAQIAASQVQVFTDAHQLCCQFHWFFLVG